MLILCLWTDVGILISSDGGIPVTLLFNGEIIIHVYIEPLTWASRGFVA